LRSEQRNYSNYKKSFVKLSMSDTGKAGEIEVKPGNIGCEPDPQQRCGPESWRVFTQGDAKTPTIEHGLFPNRFMAIRLWDYLLDEKEHGDFTNEEWLDAMAGLQNFGKPEPPRLVRVK
jgi:hypothetical protein